MRGWSINLFRQRVLQLAVPWLLWSINLFRVRGIQLALHWSFFGLLAWVAKDGWADGGGWPGLKWSVIGLLLFFGCVVLHEFGHSFTAQHFGIGVRRILLTPIGGIAEFEEIPREPAQEIAITVAGPAVNFAIAALLWATLRLTREFNVPLSLTDLAVVLLTANLYMGCFNLLPIFPMDGGRLLRAAMVWRMPYLRATFWAAQIGLALALAAVAIALLTHRFGGIAHRILAATLFTFIAFVGQIEYRAVRWFDREEARWRDVLDRLHRQNRSGESPLLKS